MHFEHLGCYAVPAIELGRRTGGRSRRHSIDSDDHCGDDDYRIIYVGHQHEWRRQGRCVRLFINSRVIHQSINFSQMKSVS